MTRKNNNHKIKILQNLNSPIEHICLPKTCKIKYIDDEGRTSLMIACIEGNIEDVKKYISEINCADDDGWTALMYAAHHGKLELFLYLIEQGADVHKKTHSGLTATQLAYFNGQYEISQLG